jgi:Diadenosine tetraphosphate (Ap4A) hydrolase and other HIT family hydrolases
MDPSNPTKGRAAILPSSVLSCITKRGKDRRMKRLWAPWRMEYILSNKTKGCVLCDKAAEEDDEKNHILHRGHTCYVMLNLYPYNNGHLMVVPYQHVPSLEIAAGVGIRHNQAPKELHHEEAPKWKIRLN